MWEAGKAGLMAPLRAVYTALQTVFLPFMIC
jgi:hypothetical protein